MTTILVTGADGFLGKNLIECLRRNLEFTVLRFDVGDAYDALTSSCHEADVVFHLANSDGAGEEGTATSGNPDLTLRIIALLLSRPDKPLVVLASSTEAALGTRYGRSMRLSEDAVEEYGSLGGNAVIFRLPSVFGKWSRPSPASVVAWLCENAVREVPVNVVKPEQVIQLIYIDDVMANFIALIDSREHLGTRRLAPGPVTSITMEALAEEIELLHNIRKSHLLPDLKDRFRRALFATYLSFIPKDDFAYGLDKDEDKRGTIAEFMKSPHAGQLTVSRTRSGFVRGNHYHNSKVEKFCVLEGTAVIRFRNIIDDEVLSYTVSGYEFRIVDIPPGYAHSIENVGTQDLVVLCWSSEIFTSVESDTHLFLIRT
jgi:UDP-2-acetamido-2,6-beta-L-arabino-hexul-4-ose reductase